MSSSLFIQESQIQKELKATKLELEAQVRKREALENEYHYSEQMFLRNTKMIRQEATKIEKKYHQMETMYEEMREERNQIMMQLQKAIGCVAVLEKQVNNLTNKYTTTDFLLTELNKSVAKHIIHRSTEERSMVADYITPGEVDEYFENENLSSLRLLDQLTKLKDSHKQEEFVKGELSEMINELRLKISHEKILDKDIKEDV